MAKTKKYVEVAPSIPLPIGKSQTFTYQIEAKDEPIPGSLVQVSIGRRQVAGTIIEIHQKKPSYRTKPITQVFPLHYTPGQLEFARWIASTMQGGLGFTLRLFAPPAGERQKLSAAKPIKRNTTGLHMAYVDTFENRWKRIPKYMKRYTEQSEQVLVIVPELWMADSIAERIPGAVTYHAGLKANEKGDIWRDVYAGTQYIVVSTQKALFLPWQNLKLIVLEEEHLDTHKLWDQFPRLDNRLAANQLSTIHESALLYSSSFPSLGLWYTGATRRITLLKNNPTKLKTTLIASSFRDRKDKRLLPQDFLYHMRKWTREKEEILVLYNKLGKRGLTEARHIFHKSPTLHAQIDKNITIGTSGLLTQIKSKKFDRVVWVYPEISMRFPDYRSYTRALTMLARLQLHTKPRRAVTIVTRYKKLLEEQLTGDWQKIFERSLKERKALSLPPYLDIVKLTCSSKTKATAFKRAEQLRQHVEEAADKNTIIRGPYQSLKPTGRKPQSHILLQGNLKDLTPLYHGLPIDTVDVYPQQVL